MIIYWHYYTWRPISYLCLITSGSSPYCGVRARNRVAGMIQGELGSGKDHNGRARNILPKCVLCVWSCNSEQHEWHFYHQCLRKKFKQQLCIQLFVDVSSSIWLALYFVRIWNVILKYRFHLYLFITSEEKIYQVFILC